MSALNVAAERDNRASRTFRVFLFQLVLLLLLLLLLVVVVAASSSLLLLSFCCLDTSFASCSANSLMPVLQRIAVSSLLLHSKMK